jgi:hypothetical protein
MTRAACTIMGTAPAVLAPRDPEGSHLGMLTKLTNAVVLGMRAACATCRALARPPRCTGAPGMHSVRCSGQRVWPAVTVALQQSWCVTGMSYLQRQFPQAACRAALQVGNVPANAAYFWGYETALAYLPRECSYTSW